MQELGAWFIELALSHHQDHGPYSYYGDGPKPDPLFETIERWGLYVKAIKASATDQSKSKRSRKDAETWPNFGARPLRCVASSVRPDAPWSFTPAWISSTSCWPA